MSVRPGFAELVHQTTMNWPVPRKNGKRRPGIGKRQQYAYLKLCSTRIHSTQTFTPR